MWCHYCGDALAPGEGTKDHVVPRAVGGPESPDNEVDACTRCNHVKAAKRSRCTCTGCLTAWRRYGPQNWSEIALAAEVPTINCRKPWGSLF